MSDEVSDQTSDQTSDKASNKKENETNKILAPTSLDTLNKGDINHYIAAEELTPLLVGTEEVITLIKTSNTPNSKGTAILLPDWQQTATNPKSINFLRQHLPNEGWTTITIQPPSKPENYPSTALTYSEQQEENQLTIKAYHQQLSAIMLAVTEKAKGYPGIMMIIAEGQNAAHLASLYQQNKNTVPEAFILLSSYLSDTIENQKFTADLAQTDYPVLDLYLTRDHPLALKSAALRLTSANKAMKAFYRQKQLGNITTGYYPQHKLLSALNGWLKSMGW